MKAGTNEWWEVVQTGPLLEAEEMLASYKVQLFEGLQLGTAAYFSAGVIAQRVNAELARIRYIRHRSTFRDAVRNVCDDEQYAAVCAEQARLENEARATAPRGG